MSVHGEESTESLVDRARDPAAALDDQHAAFAKLVERSQHLALGVALTLLPDVEDARDAAQEAFTLAWLRLPQLRDAKAFPAWLRTIVSSQCARRLRDTRQSRDVAPEPPAGRDTSRTYRALVTSAVSALPEDERHVTVLFYFLGYTLPEIARLLHLKPGTVGKRLHAARLRMRRRLPPTVRGEFIPLAPSRRFVDRVRLGLFDEYVGEYRFEERPDHVVSIVREGDALISQAGGQRHVLLSLDGESLLTRHYDGEGRFQRDRQGNVTHFFYYEFGKRLGIARKMTGLSGSPPREVHGPRLHPRVSDASHGLRSS